MVGFQVSRTKRTINLLAGSFRLRLASFLADCITKLSIGD